MPSNQEYLEKSITASTHLASFGKLLPKQSDKFLDYVFDETMLASLGIRTEKFRNEQMTLPKINVPDRVAVPAVEAQDPGVRRGISTSQITLQPVEIMVPFEISENFKEVNVEGDSAVEHIVKMMATRAANNIEELYLHGNSVGPAILESDYVEGGDSSKYRLDSYLQLFDGLLKQAGANHTYDAQNEDFGPRVVAGAVRALPDKWKKNLNKMRMLMSFNHEHAYREAVASRSTVKGDQALEGQDRIRAFGVIQEPLSLLGAEPSYTEHVVANNDGTTATPLSYGPITELVILPSTLGATAVTPYVLGVDYSVDLAAGTFTRLGAGAIPSGGTVKVTYKTAGRMILTDPRNILLAIGRDITIGRDFNIYKRVHEFAMHLKVYITFEETDGVVLVENVKVPV